MKIAIQGHPTRGKEVIQILESLGGLNSLSLLGTNSNRYYFIYDNNVIMNMFYNANYKIYTLEEFEKEFPFKIGDKVIWPVKVGWWSGIIVDLSPDYYKIIDDKCNYHYVEPYKLQLYPMKEERNITLTLEKAKEWYRKGGELKEVALQAFTEKELNPLPRSWEEFCEKYPIKDREAHFDSISSIIIQNGDATVRASIRDRNICPSQKSAEAHLAMIQLEQLRDCWRQGWKPECNEHHKYGIRILKGELTVIVVTNIPSFLTFPTRKMAEEFLECFKDLIKQAGDLI